MNCLPYLPLIPALPLLASVVLSFVGPAKSKPARFPGLLCSALLAVSFLLAVGCALNLRHVPDGRFELRGGTWIAGGEWGFLFDLLSAELSLLIAGIGTLIGVYSLAYMSEEREQGRFFASLSFFAAMMQVLVLANNYLLAFAGWEGVGLASYLLIGYHHERWKAGVAAMKAFVINRAADAAMMLALFFLLAKTGSTHFATVLSSSATWSDNEITFATVFLFIGAMGKSAQFPLHIWLPDAMEGPTPVSAFIHSATMVCAGVYLIARSGFLFLHSPDVNLAIAIIGSLTSFIAATIALVENDIKRVLAYSTVSQIGFMFVALGAGAYQAALFHLFTHAFFKSLLFLGSGSLIHALNGEQNLKHMGGLWRKMPATFVTMAAASLALSAIPGFAGFFSKDAILANTHSLPFGWLFLLGGLATSFLTAAYAARLMILAFFGAPVYSDPVHESPKTMLVPMIVLSVGCIVAGWIGPKTDWSEWPLMLVSTLVAAAGIGLARKLYLVSPARRVSLTAQFRPVVELLRSRWYIDALYEERILNGIVPRAAGAFTTMDETLIDGATDRVSLITVLCSRVFGWFDRNIVDGLVRGLSGFARLLSLPTRAIQSGFVQNYALIFITGLLAALGYYLSRAYFPR